MTVTKMNKFRTPYDHLKFVPDYDSRCRDEIGDFLEEFDKKTGVLKFNQIGKTNAFDAVQANKEYSDLKNVIRRYQLGDTTAIGNPEKAIYADVSKMTMNLMDAQNMLLRAQHDFDALDTSVKQKFNNNYMEYAAQAGTTDWFEKLGIPVTTDIKAITEPDVKPEDATKPDKE